MSLKSRTALLMIPLLCVVIGLVPSGGANPYSTPGTGVLWTMDDLVSNSSGAVIYGLFSYIFEIHENITISANDRLTMQAGELIHFHNGTGMFVEGDLRVEGNETNVVRMTAGTFPVTERFYGIVFREGSTGNLYRCELLESLYGIRITNSSPTISDCAFLQGNNGVWIEDGATPVVRNGTFIALEEQAIMVDNAAPTIMNNTIVSNKLGIFATNGSSPLIESNNISDNYGFGIELISSPNTLIRNNTILHNIQDGVIMFNATGTIIEDSNISANGFAGTGHWYRNIFAEKSSLDIRNNYVGDAMYGIWLTDSNSLIRDNTFSNSTSGLVATEGSTSTVSNNTFEESNIHSRATTMLRIENNTFHRSLLQLHASEVSNNTIEAGDISLYENATLRNNLIEDGGDGIWIQGHKGSRVEIHETTIRDTIFCGIKAIKSAEVEVINSTIENSGIFDVSVISSRVIAVNSSLSETRHLDNGTLVIKNYLHVTVLDSNANPLEGVSVVVNDVRPAIALTRVHDRKSDSNGQVKWLAVTDGIYTDEDTWEENETYLDIFAEGHYFAGFPRSVDMSTSHTEVVVEDDMPPPPTVTLTNPADGEEGVPANTSITIRFSHRMNETSVGNSISISGTQIGDLWSTTDGTTFFVLPSQDLENGTVYEVVITTEARDIAGQHLSDTHTFRFTTERIPSEENVFMEFVTDYWWAILVIVLACILVGVFIILARRRRIPPPPPEAELPPEPEDLPPPPPHD